MAVWLDFDINKIYYLLLEGTMYTQLTEDGPKDVKRWCLHIYDSDKSRHRVMVTKRKETEYRDLMVLDLTGRELFERSHLATIVVKGQTPGDLSDRSTDLWKRR